MGHIDRAPSLTKGLAVVVVGADDDELAKRIADHLSETFDCPVRILANKPAANATADEEVNTLVSAMEANDVALLALMNIAGDVKFRQSVFPSRRVGLLNVRGLKSDLMSRTGSKPGDYLGIVEKESVRIVGEIIGLPACPMRWCAMYEAKSPNELAEKARNLCPPCRAKALKILKSKGAILCSEKYSGQATDE